MKLYVQNSIFKNRKKFPAIIYFCFSRSLVKIDIIQIEYLVHLINVTFITIEKIG